MRIVIHGQQAFGRAVLERLIEREEDIVAVCTEDARSADADAILRRRCVHHGLCFVVCAATGTRCAQTRLVSVPPIVVTHASRTFIDKLAHCHGRHAYRA